MRFLVWFQHLLSVQQSHLFVSLLTSEMWLWPLFRLFWLTSAGQINVLYSKAACLFVRKTASAFKNTRAPVLCSFFKTISAVIVAIALSFSSGPNYRAGCCDFQGVGVYIHSVTSASFEIFQLFMPHFLPVSSEHNDQSGYTVPDVCGWLTW